MSYRIDDHMRHRIITMRENGATVTDISDELGISRPTVYTWCKRWGDEGTVKCYVSKGRNKKTTPETDRLLVENVMVQRFISVPTYAAELNVSSNTIRRRLKSAGLRHRVPARKPLLNDRHKRLRLNFANYYQNFDFEKVVFVDEKVFTTNQDGRVSLYRPENTRYDERYVLANRRSGRLSLGFWGWIAASGPGELVEISTRMNAKSYLEILNEVLMPSLRAYFGDEKIYLLQDNSSVHNSRIVQAWIDDQENLELIRLSPCDLPQNRQYGVRNSIICPCNKDNTRQDLGSSHMAAGSDSSLTCRTRLNCVLLSRSANGEV